MSGKDSAVSNNADLWQFANKLYADDAIKGLCLELQDRYGCNVLLVLWGLWLEASGQAIACVHFERLSAHALDVSSRYIQPLRGLRRRSSVDASLTCDLQADVKQQLLCCELAFEKCVLQRLQCQTDSLLSDLSPVATVNESVIDVNFILSSQLGDNGLVWGRRLTERVVALGDWI